VVEKIKAHILFSKTFFPKIVSFMRYRGEILYSRTGHRYSDHFSYSIKLMVFVTETQRVYCAVRTNPLIGIQLWRKGEVHTAFCWGGDLGEGDHLGDPGVDRRIILKWTFKKWDGGMDWIELAQDRGRWRALVNAVMNLRVPQNAGNFLTS
jgi:hypothetical protein